MNTSKIWTKGEIKDLLEKNDEMVKRSLLVVYSLQTSDEQYSEQTKYQNGVGFNSRDGEIMSSFAQQLQAKGYLSPKQLELARNKLMKYSGQLVKVANNEINISEENISYKKSS
jgi:hypothetical protein